ncbi:hypothetical protein AbaIHSS3526_17665 [Acinetobacter baumannii]|uniref:hypothetical protein n=1 Tax=Acinetobacter baumannii TaxID=470 RepID=UPI000CE549BA|nr:hypothetical protein [Acinetobacter baumannii]MDP7843617.1 hypothetical protein [Acinetobacter baumannii]MDP7865083.1 hypothetical protein [Acinetobacter baumannii]PPC34147.1 hypothetical protein AbaIHSS3526_17665 [Acinetobacter baumannii]TPU73870.1 hypothetical protein FJU41_11505 [Acinetobacter baumannii]
MTDLNKLRSEFESDLADHLIERDANGFYINDEIQNYWEKHLLKAQIKELKAELEKAKAQAVPEGYVLLPRVPTEKMFQAYERYSVAPMSTLSKTGYKAMVEAAGDQNENS